MDLLVCNKSADRIESLAALGREAGVHAEGNSVLGLFNLSTANDF